MRKAIIAIVIVILAIVLLTQSLYTVDEKEQAIIVQVGEYKETVTHPGLHIKIPFLQTVTTFEKRVLSSDAAPTSYLTLDKKNLVIDHITRWRIEDPRQFYVTVRSEGNALQRLQAIVVSELRDEVASHDFADMISIQREPIMETVAQRTGEKVREFGMEIIDVRLKRADLPDEVRDSVFDRMRAERQRISKQNRAEGEEQAFKTRAEADREATVILAEAYKTEQTLKGEGDALATAIYAVAYEEGPEFYSLLRALEAYGKFMDEETTLVLSSDSELFKHLASSSSGE